jgi:prepilin-type N-terminal cleavage/methylation domain-containing protein
MIRPRDNRNDTRGFTVIEVMIALVVTLIALDVVFGGIVTSLRTVNTTASWDSAISRAESHLAAITDPPLAVGERQGDDGDGYRWRTRVAFLGSAHAPAPPAAVPGRAAPGSIRCRSRSSGTTAMANGVSFSTAPGSAPLQRPGHEAPFPGFTPIEVLVVLSVVGPRAAH